MPLPAPADSERFRCELYYVLLDFLTDIEIRRGTLEGISYAEDCFKLLHALRFRCELYYVLLDCLTDIEIRRGTLEGISYAEDCFKLLHALRFRDDLVEIAFETLAETGTDFGKLRTPRELRFVDEFLEILSALID